MSSDSTDSVFDNFREDPDNRSSADTDTTPSSELSPPDSPTSKSLTLTETDDKRADARKLAASLSLEEQVSHSSPFFWRWEIHILSIIRSHY
jgi:beta-glucosidase